MGGEQVARECLVMVGRRMSLRVTEAQSLRQRGAIRLACAPRAKLLSVQPKLSAMLPAITLLDRSRPP
jgi:hypothetical protein